MNRWLRHHRYALGVDVCGACASHPFSSLA